MLENKRIYLRKFKVEDAPALLKWGQDNLYHQTAGFERFTNLKEAQRAAKQYQKRLYSFAIIEKTHQKMIGLVELYERGLDEQVGLLVTKDLGFMLDKEYWHQGLMTEALTTIINYAFNDLKQQQLWASTLSNNDASQRILEKLGFKYIYTADFKQVSETTNFEEKYFLLTPDDWCDKMQLNMKS